jgi:hypothetical protein
MSSVSRIQFLANGAGLEFSQKRDASIVTLQPRKDAPRAISADTFVKALFDRAPADARAMITSFSISPKDKKGWPATPHDPNQPLPSMNGKNAYISIASFGPKATHRRSTQPHHVLAIGLDDIGSKGQRDEVLRKFGPPSAEVETSKDNWHFWYFLEAPITKDDIDPIHDKLFARKILSDTGGLNSVRWLRLPTGNNTKSGKDNFAVRITAWNPERHFSLAFIRDALGINDVLNDKGHAPRYTPPATVHSGECAADVQPGEVQGRDDALLKHGASLAAKGVAHDLVLDAMRNYNQVHCKPPETDEKVKEKWKQVCKYHPETRSQVDEVNAKHALIYVKGKAGIMWRAGWHGGMPTISSVKDIRLDWMNRQQGKANPIDKWLRSTERQTYRGIVYEPGMTDVGEALNMFTGWGVEPVKGDCSLILEHLRVVICNRDERSFQYLLQWLANAVQDPRKKSGTAIYIRSEPGAGKGTLANYLQRILENNYLFLNHSDDLLTTNHNDFLAGKLMCFVDEVVWPRNHSGVKELRSYITEKNIFINPKYIPAFMIPSYVRFIMFTNEDHAAPVDLYDRRCVMLVASDEYRDDHNYWCALEAEAQGTGPAAFLHHLLHEVKITLQLRDIPKTAALAEQKILGLEPVGEFWRAMLQTNDHEFTDRDDYHSFAFGETVGTAVLYDFFIHYATGHNLFRSSLDAFGKRLREYVTIIKREATSLETEQLSLLPRKQVYVLPTLQEARQQFETALEVPADDPLIWPEEEEIHTTAERKKRHHERDDYEM